MAISWSMDKIGPMCRSAEDCALVFAAIHGADGLDPTARTTPFRWDAVRDPREIRVGFLERAFEEAERYPNRDHDLETLRVLREDVGIDLLPVDLPEFPIDALGFILTAEAAAAFDNLTRSGRDAEAAEALAVPQGPVNSSQNVLCTTSAEISVPMYPGA